MKSYVRKALTITYFLCLAGIGVVLGCFIHGSRVNQTTVMSGVAFVREFPYGEHVVGWLETTVFSYQEAKNLEAYKEKHKGNIKIDPKVLEEQERLFNKSQ